MSNEKWTPELEREFKRLSSLRERFKSQQEDRLLRAINLMGQLDISPVMLAALMKKNAGELYAALEPFAQESLPRVEETPRG